MTEAEARHILGVGPAAPPTTVRAAYLALVRANHPDVAADPIAAGPITAAITEAYRVLRALPSPTPTPRPSPHVTVPVRRPHGVEVISPEAIWIDQPPPVAFPAVTEAADALGEVSYVDRSVGLVQVAVRPDGGPTCWLTIGLHRRPGGTVAVCTLESIEADPTPPAGPIIDAFASFLAERLAPAPP